LITAFIVTLIELFSPPWLDDNLSIPIGTAIVLTLLA
jgi:dolichol kinase